MNEQAIVEKMITFIEKKERELQANKMNADNRAKNDIIKKTGASACANAPVCNQSLHKFSINSASWIIYNLPEFKLIVCHGWPPLLSMIAFAYMM